MKIKPILFNTEMVEAILDNRKTMTRRMVKPQPIELSNGKLLYKQRNRTKTSFINECKYEVGDLLWVRETFRPLYNCETGEVFRYEHLAENQDFYKHLKEKGDARKWKPSIYMPKEACRIFLKITNIRVERLKDISENDAVLEGIKIIHFAEGKFAVFKNYLIKENIGSLNPLKSFFSLWESIHGKGKLESNPWVWVIEFERCKKPENFLL